MSLDSIKKYLIELRTYDNMKAQADQLVEQTLDELSVKTLQSFKDSGRATEAGHLLATNKIRKANKAKEFFDNKGYLRKEGPKIAASNPEKKARARKLPLRIWDSIEVINRPKLNSLEEDLEYFLENYDQLDELSKGKINYYLSKAVPHHDDNDRANKSYDSIDFKKGSATYKAVKARQKEHKDVIRRRSSGIKLANRRLQTAQEDVEYFLENSNPLSSHISSFKTKFNTDSENPVYNNQGKVIPNMKQISTKVDHQKLFDYFKEKGFKKTKGYDPKPNEWTKSHNPEEMTTTTDSIHHPSGVSVNLTSTHGEPTKLWFNHNIRESSELDNVVNKETMPELYARIMNRKAAMDKLNSEMEKAPHEIELF